MISLAVELPCSGMIVSTRELWNPIISDDSDSEWIEIPRKDVTIISSGTDSSVPQAFSTSSSVELCSTLTSEALTARGDGGALSGVLPARVI